MRFDYRRWHIGIYFKGDDKLEELLLNGSAGKPAALKRTVPGIGKFCQRYLTAAISNKPFVILKILFRCPRARICLALIEKYAFHRHAEEWIHHSVISVTKCPFRHFTSGKFGNCRRRSNVISLDILKYLAIWHIQPM